MVFSGVVIRQKTVVSKEILNSEVNSQVLYVDCVMFMSCTLMKVKEGIVSVAMVVSDWLLEVVKPIFVELTLKIVGKSMDVVKNMVLRRDERLAGLSVD